MHSSQTFVMENSWLSASAPSLLKLPVEKTFLIVFALLISLCLLPVRFCRIKFNFESPLIPLSFGLKKKFLVLIIKKIIVFYNKFEKDLALKRTEEISLPFLLTAFPFDRIFKPGEHQAWHFVHSAGKCGGKILLAPCHPCTHTAGRTVPSCPAIHRSFRLLYIPSVTYISNFWCLWFGANLYAKT